MPYQWTETAPDVSGAVSHRLLLWPYRSLPRRGFVWFIGVTAVLLGLPMVALLGSSALWGLLPFEVLAVVGIWLALQHSYRSGETREELRLSSSRLYLRRTDPGQPPREWETNTYWVRAMLRPGPVEDYLTLSDGKREIELGGFLTPEERRQLLGELQQRLVALR